MKSQKTFIREFKKELDIDFRKHQFLDNQYGGTPCFDYDFAKEIVTTLNNNLIDLFNDQYVIYNTEMDIESLRTTQLKNYILDRVDTYYSTYKRENIEG